MVLETFCLGGEELVSTDLFFLAHPFSSFSLFSVNGNYVSTAVEGDPTLISELSCSGNRISIADLEDIIPQSVTEVLDFGLRFEVDWARSAR